MWGKEERESQKNTHTLNCFVAGGRENLIRAVVCAVVLLSANFIVGVHCLQINICAPAVKVKLNQQREAEMRRICVKFFCIVVLDR